MKKVLFALLFLPSLAFARPLITEPAETVGKYTFEGGGSISLRNDEFGPGDNNLRTVYFPAFVRFGLFEKVDLLVLLEHVTQDLDVGAARFKGSSEGRFSGGLKISPFENAGVAFYWHAKSPEVDDQEISLARGNDFEANLLFSKPEWGIHLNAGYVFRESYVTDFSVPGQGKAISNPGDFFQASAAIEIPLTWDFYLLNEWTYYDIAKQTLGGLDVPDSEGTAADAIIGLTWVRGGWNIGGGVGFGLLDESHTSFDPTRGSGDSQFLFSLSYRFKPRPPERWDQ